MNKIFYLCTFVAVLFYGITSTKAQVKESTLWGANGINWNPVGRLPDFSYAGYHFSEKDLPTIAQVYNLSNNPITGTKAKPNDGLDDAAFLQQLINATTGGGVIFVPAGRWNMDSDIKMNTKGLVIRGAVNSNGNPTTEFYQSSPRFPTPKTSGSVTTGIITIQGSQSFSAEIGKVAVDAKQGATAITLTNVGTLAKGDFIRMIQYDPADGSLADFLTGGVYQGSETAAQKDKFRWFAKIVGVSGKTITLDRPLPIPANVKWTPSITKFDLNNSISEMGVENIQFTFNNKIEFDHLKFYGFSAITMNRATNCWVKNVVIVDSESGIAVTGESCFNTLRGITFRDVQRKQVVLPLPGSANYSYNITQVGTGHHPLYFLSSFYNLVEQFSFENIYWHEIGVEDHAHMNVYRNGKGVALAFDNHKLLPYSNLWTNIDAGVPARIFWNSGLNAVDANGNDRRGVNAGIRNTYWNIKFDNSIHKLAAAPNGTAGFKYLNLIGLKGVTVNDGTQLAELTGTNDQIAQPDLFQAQLDRRLKGTVTEIENEVVELEQESSISVFPNPSVDGIFYLSKACLWKVSDVHGQELKVGTGNQIDISESPKGIYLININDRMERIVVE